jgi:hypothetical protein
MIRAVALATAGGLLHVAAILLDWLEPPRPHVDEPITDGDPGYSFEGKPQVQLRIIDGGTP